MKKNLKNKKGFTLIELLVTVVLLVSALAIAIVSMTNVSKKQKKNAYEQVKKQVEAAAEQYFEANEYNYEGLTGTIESGISVEKLVESGYLNSLTNPETGAKLSNCAGVKVTKQGAKYITEFSEGGMCYGGNQLFVAEAGATKGNAYVYKTADIDNTTPLTDYNKWYNYDITGGEDIKICIKPDREDIKEITFAGNKLDKSDKYCFSVPYDIYINGYFYEIENLSGRIFKSEFKYGLDRTKPEIKNVFSTEKKITADLSDQTSGLDKLNINGVKKKTYDANVMNASYDSGNSLNSGTSYKLEVTDVAGNTSDPVSVGTKTTTKKSTTTTTTKPFTTGDNIAPRVTLKIYKRNSDGSNGTLVKQGVYQGTASADNSVGVNDSKWMNKVEFPYGINVVYSADEDLSSAYWYWNKAGLTISQAKAGENQWIESTKCYGNYCKSVSDIAKVGIKNNPVQHEFSGDGSRRARIYVEDKAGNETKIYISAYFDKVINTPTITMDSNGKTLGSNKVSLYDINFTLSASDTISGISKIQYSFDGSNWNDYSKKTSVLKSTGSKIISARAIDKAGNISAISQSIAICNKDKIEVDADLGNTHFYLPFTLNGSSEFEYVVWKQTATNDSVQTAQNKNLTINGTTTKYSSGLAAKHYCGDFESQLGSKVKVSNKSKKINITRSPNGKYYAMYYCLAVRPVKNRNNLTSIGNIFRGTIYQPSNPNVNNTGWTIQYKHVYGS